VDVSAASLGSIPLTGDVAFYDQAGMIGTAPVVDGTAKLTTSALAKGNYMVYAVYQGDTNYAPSATGTIEQMIMSTAPAAPAKSSAHSKKAAAKPKAPAAKPREVVAVKTSVKKSSDLSR
jgi:hypothetical protein